MSGVATWVAREESQTGESPERRGHHGVSWTHRTAALLSALDLVLILLWTLAAARTAFRVSPHWPTLHVLSHPFRFAPYGALYRRLAVIASCCTLGLAIRLTWAGWPAYVKWFSWAPVVLMVGLTGLESASFFSRLTVERAVANDLALQIIFSLAVCLALFTRSDWDWNLSKIPDVRTPSFRSLSVATAVMVAVEVIFGASYSGLALPPAPHILLAFFAVAGALWLLELGFAEIRAVPVLKIATILLAELLAMEFFLGLVTYSLRLDDPTMAKPGFIVMAVAHAGVGALCVPAGLYVTFQAFRHLENSRRPSKSLK